MTDSMVQDLPKVLVTAGPNAPDDGSTIVTPPGAEDLQAATSRWWVQVLVRFARTYLQSLLGTWGTLTSGIPQQMGMNLSEFGNTFYLAAVFAVAPAVVSLAQNTLEFLVKLDTSNPKWRG
jgi:hypothetical protein